MLADSQELIFLPFDVYLKDFLNCLKQPEIKMCARYPATFLELTISLARQKIAVLQPHGVSYSLKGTELFSLRFPSLQT